MDVSVNLSADLTPIVQTVADQLSEMGKGTRKVAEALLGPWIASRDRNTLLIKAQTAQDVAKIKDGCAACQKTGCIAPNPQAEYSAYDVIHRLCHISDAQRLKETIEAAARMLEAIDPAEISDEPLSTTFFNRWRREAEIIDDADMRRWWAGLLKDEVVRQNSVSPKTLDVVKNLSRKDCLSFVSLCRGALQGELLVNYDHRPVFGTYEDVAYFQGIGLLGSLSVSAKMSPNVARQDVVVQFCGATKGLRFLHGHFDAYVFSVSGAGRDLLRVVGEPDMSDDDVSAFAAFVEKNRLGADGVDIVDVPYACSATDWTWQRGHRVLCYE